MAVHLRNRSGFCYSRCFVTARKAWGRLSDGGASRSLSRLRPVFALPHAGDSIIAFLPKVLVIVFCSEAFRLSCFSMALVWLSYLVYIFVRVSKVTAVCSPRAPPRPGAGVGVRVSGGSIHDRASRLRLAPRPRRSGSVRLSASTPLGLACAPLYMRVYVAF